MENYDGSSIDHLNIGVSDPERSSAFYEQALAPLGTVLTMSVPTEKAEAGGQQAKRFVGLELSTNLTSKAFSEAEISLCGEVKPSVCFVGW